MKTLPALVAILVLFVASSAPATGLGVDPNPGQEQVCGPGDSGKVDVVGNFTSLVLTAPAGKLISGYCVKAGSINQGDGPEYVPVDPPLASVTISHSTGKDISHHSVVYVNVAQEPTPTPTTEPTATPTTEPTATPTTEPTATPTIDPTATPTPDPTSPRMPDPRTEIDVLALQQTPTPDPQPEPIPAEPEQLAVTGFESNLAAVGASLLAIGLALSWYGRRRLNA